MKILVMTDIEGVSGVVDFKSQTGPEGRYYEQAKKLLTAEVNAAVEGMVEEDVDDILVVDGHGWGGLVFEDLHPAAKLMHGTGAFLSPRSNEVYKGYDATILIGQHAMAGTTLGNMNHTQNSTTREYCKLNGKYIGETGQWALHSGLLGVPTIFLSGDEAACAEAEELIDGITTAAVKEGLSRSAAISLSKEQAHSRIKAGIKQAIQKQRKSPIAPLVWEGPYVMEMRFLYTDTADRYMRRSPLYERIDSRTVQLKSDNLMEILY